MNVLSLFDGISCGRVALERAAIPVTNYYASEIDKYAIQVSNKNYPDTIQLGDIEDHLVGLNVWPEEVDLVIGGSPCQGFSFAGKQLAFDDPRSKLFFKFVEIVNYYKPKYFLLENVRMKKEHQDIISKYLGVEPICINSSLVSAQNRVRYYWTNIPNVTQPEDRNIYLKDIIQENIVDQDKSYRIDANYWKGGNLKQYFEKHRRQLIFSKRSLENIIKNHRQLDQKAVSLCANSNITGAGVTNVMIDSDLSNMFFRKLTPIECERLQTLPDNYTEGVSNTQRYKMLGNAWTVDVIAHIFKGLL